MKDYYGILGLKKGATESEIKSAYRQMAKKYHPDLHPGDKSAEEKFKDINEAYQVLSDPNKKAIYDQGGDPNGQNPFGAGANPFGGGFSFNVDGDPFESIFNMFTGGSQTRSRTRGEDIEIVVDLTFMEAAKGAKKIITLNRNEPCSSCNGTGAHNNKYHKCAKCGGTGFVTVARNTLFGRTMQHSTCPDCNGTGRIIDEVCPDCKGKGIVKKEKKITVDIPAGIDDGNVISVRGEGNAARQNNAEKGDLIIEFNVKPHKLLKRRGLDLYSDVPISITCATLGGQIDLYGLDGIFTYDIPAGTQSGEVFKIRNKGIQSRKGKGDFYVRVNVEIPKNLDRKQKEALKDFGKELEDKQAPKTKDYHSTLKDLLYNDK